MSPSMPREKMVKLVAKDAGEYYCMECACAVYVKTNQSGCYNLNLVCAKYIRGSNPTFLMGRTHGQGVTALGFFLKKKK